MAEMSACQQATRVMMSMMITHHCNEGNRNLNKGNNTSKDQGRQHHWYERDAHLDDGKDACALTIAMMPSSSGQ
jgi:hypothetical protein